MVRYFEEKIKDNEGCDIHGPETNGHPVPKVTSKKI